MLRNPTTFGAPGRRGGLGTCPQLRSRSRALGAAEVEIPGPGAQRKPASPDLGPAAPRTCPQSLSVTKTLKETQPATQLFI